MPRGPSRPSRVTQLEELRRLAGFNTADLAEAVGVSQAHISRIERGTTPASPRVKAAVLRALAAHLGQALFDEKGIAR